ncbi:MAG TPA: hypothetical protein VFQ60_04890, partial [Patescibacteria group bacterium]|nr:hypothetical protein [Patescibacteria group bacterium]
MDTASPAHESNERARWLTFLRHFLKRHWLPLALAAALGALVAFPSFYFHFASGQYHGIDLFRSDGELNQLAAIREAYDGHLMSGNVYTADGKNDPIFTQQPFPAIVLAGFARLFFVSPQTINLVTKFFLPFLLALLLFAFLSLVLENRAAAALGTALFFLAPASTSFFLDPGSWFRILFHGNFGDGKYQFLYYARSINPQFSFFFIIGYFYLLWKLLAGGHT